MSNVKRIRYTVTFKFVDYDAEIQKQYFTNWADTCRFMKSLLDDGYEILNVNG